MPLKVLKIFIFTFITMLNIHSYCDNDLIILLKKGDHRAFEVIYQRYWKPMFVLAVNRLGNETDGEEVVQDIFTDLWRRRESIDIKHNLNAYLAGAVKFRVYATLARQYKKRALESGIQTSLKKTQSESAEDILLLKKLKEKIDGAAENLPERCQLIFKLSREDGYSNKEIAHYLRISEKTVETQISRALKRIKTALQGLITLF